jgi:hypothetical protein
MADKFILIEKDGFKIEVHPLTLANHLELGWVIVPVEEKKEMSAADAAAHFTETMDKPKAGLETGVKKKK